MTERTKYTPGRWRVHSKYKYEIWGGDYLVARTKHAGDSDLIAAAPEMLDEIHAGRMAAQRVIETWERGDLAEAVRRLDEWQFLARNTIAKAEGRDA